MPTNSSHYNPIMTLLEALAFHYPNKTLDSHDVLTGIDNILAFLKNDSALDQPTLIQWLARLSGIKSRLRELKRDEAGHQMTVLAQELRQMVSIASASPPSG